MELTTFEAIEFSRENFEQIREWSNGKIHSLKIPKCMDGVATAKIKIKDEVFEIKEGDHIVKKESNKLCICSELIYPHVVKDEAL